MSTATKSSAEVAIAAIDAMAVGGLDQLQRFVHPDAVNREALAEPPATRGRGPAAFFATALWLRAAFSDLVFTPETVMTDGDLVAWYGTMSGRSTGEFEVWTCRRADRPGVPGDGPRVHRPPGAFPAHPGRARDRALGGPRRPGHGPAGRVDPAHAGCSSSAARSRPRERGAVSADRAESRSGIPRQEVREVAQSRPPTPRVRDPRTRGCRRRRVRAATRGCTRSRSEG